MKGAQPSVHAVVNMPQAAVIPPVAAMPPHTSTRGYGHPGSSSNPLPSPQPTPPASYMNVVPPTPYSHHASFVYTNQSQATSIGIALRGTKTRNSISRKIYIGMETHQRLKLTKIAYSELCNRMKRSILKMEIFLKNI
jgi:hypothetical protein